MKKDELPSDMVDKFVKLANPIGKQTFPGKEKLAIG